MKKWLMLLLTAALLLTAFTGCAGKDEETVSVQSVSMICGLGSVGLNNRYAGVVSARSVTEIEKDQDKVIDQLLVAEGDLVTEGQLLFTYDSEQAELLVEKGRLELEQLRATVTAKEAEKASLEKEKAKAKESAQLSYSLAIMEAETAIREANYNITIKEKELSALEASLENLEVTSPVAGRIRSLNEDGGSQYQDYYGPGGNTSNAFITIMETGTYRIKAYINEQNAYSLPEGMRVLIRSRLDDSVTWTGTVAEIDWENGTSGGNNYYYVDDSEGETGRSTSYPFYVELDDASGLLLGQHVYIELATGEAGEGLNLPSWYVFDVSDDGSSGKVWAQDARGRLEKRTVSLGGFNEDLQTYAVLKGLTGDDYIAYPDETLKAGMLCTLIDESAFEISDTGSYDMPLEDDYSVEYGEYAYDESMANDAYELPAEEYEINVDEAMG